VHLVGFIIRIYHDARSSDCQILSVSLKLPGHVTDRSALFSADVGLHGAYASNLPHGFVARYLFQHREQSNF
jgi:hypothetical protein